MARDMYIEKRWISIFISSWMLSSCYSLSQAYHFNNLVNSRIPVDEAMTSQPLSAQSKSSVRALKDILHFARQSGLKVGDSYRYFIQHPGGAVSYSLQAADSDKLQFVTWWFPIVGRVPYLGFYELNERDKKFDALKAQGYDVAKGAVAAFSGLGWFSDPLFSSMLDRPIEEFSQLIFHELTHKTFWISNSAEFNENLAEFVSRNLTLAYLTDRQLVQARSNYQAMLDDTHLYQTWLAGLRAALEKLYKSGLPKLKVLEKKKLIFSEFTSSKRPRFKTDRYGFIEKRDWNNAYVMAAGLYVTDLRPFETAYKCAKNPPYDIFLSRLKAYAKDVKSGFEALKLFCK